MTANLLIAILASALVFALLAALMFYLDGREMRRINRMLRKDAANRCNGHAR